MSGSLADIEALERLKAQVIARTGHAYYNDKDRLLVERIQERMRATGAASVADYAVLLDADEGEQRALESAITINETYFFRHPEQYEALRGQVLPRLLAARADTKTLRVWSIGCSTGAEPFSVAIILREMLGALIADWRITIVGGDISDAALERARTGVFSPWALRTLRDDERLRYFDRVGERWKLKGLYRAMVRFERQNLLDLVGPSRPYAWAGFDLILCRNVLIYFSLEQASAMAGALRSALAPDGELVLGPVEAAITGETTLRGIDAASASVEAETLQPAGWTPLLDPLFQTMLPASWSVIEPAPPVANEPANEPAPGTKTGEARIDEVRRLADAGAYEEAHALCQRLIAETPVSARLQYYDAILRQVSEDRTGAEAALRRAIYLDRSFALAHHRLGALMLTAGRTEEARRALNAAVRLAETSPADAEIAEGQGLTAGDFARQVREQLDRLGGAR